MSGTISFSTANNISEGTRSGLWQFAGGGTLALIATVVDSDGNIVVDNDTLFTGAFGSTVQLVAASGSVIVALGGTDDFNSALAALLGVSTDSDYEFSFTSIAEGSAPMVPTAGSAAAICKTPM